MEGGVEETRSRITILIDAARTVKAARDIHRIDLVRRYELSALDWPYFITIGRKTL
jgi:hypothetical protein